MRSSLSSNLGKLSDTVGSLADSLRHTKAEVAGLKMIQAQNINAQQSLIANQRAMTVLIAGLREEIDQLRAEVESLKPEII